MSELKRTKEWFNAAIPSPTIDQACIQIGCHYEEFAEMLCAMGDADLYLKIDDIAKHYKECSHYYLEDLKLSVNRDEHKVELLDSLVDQIVTAIGVAHMLGMDIEGALAEVNDSNYSKFEDGSAVFDANGKIKKGKNYSKPDLSPYVGGKYEK